MLSVDDSDEDASPIVETTQETTSYMNVDFEEEAYPSSGSRLPTDLLASNPLDLNRHESTTVDIEMLSTSSDNGNGLSHETDEEFLGSEAVEDEELRPKVPFFVIPLNAVLVSSSVGLLCFLGSKSSSITAGMVRIFRLL